MPMSVHTWFGEYVIRGGMRPVRFLPGNRTYCPLKGWGKYR